MIVDHDRNQRKIDLDYLYLFLGSIPALDHMFVGSTV